MKEIKKARSNSFYFPSQYSDPFHRDEKRIERVDFQNFDPYSPNNRQVVANCKKHRRQKHELSDKCKQVLSIIDVQERLLSVKDPQMSEQGAPAIQADILIKFGDGIPKITKNFIKKWITTSGLVKEPFSREYDVHTMNDAHKHNNRFTIILKVPFFEGNIESTEKEKQIIDAFMEDPKKFSEHFAVKPVYLYGRNKISGEDDAFGTSVDGHPGPIAMVEGKYVEPINKAIRLINTPEDAYANMTAAEKKTLMENENRYRNSRDRSEMLRRRAAELREQLDSTEQEADQTSKQQKKLRQKEIINNVFSPEKNIAPTRVEGGWTNPIGQTLRAIETGAKMLGNVGDAIERHNEYKSKLRAQEAELDAKMRKLLEESDRTERQADDEESDMRRNLVIAEETQSGKFEEAGERLRESIEKPVQREKDNYATMEARAQGEKLKQEKQQPKAAEATLSPNKAVEETEGEDFGDVDMGGGFEPQEEPPTKRTFEWGPDVDMSESPEKSKPKSPTPQKTELPKKPESSVPQK